MVYNISCSPFSEFCKIPQKILYNKEIVKFIFSSVFVIIICTYAIKYFIRKRKERKYKIKIDKIVENLKNLNYRSLMKNEIIVL